MTRTSTVLLKRRPGFDRLTASMVPGSTRRVRSRPIPLAEMFLSLAGPKSSTTGETNVQEVSALTGNRSSLRRSLGWDINLPPCVCIPLHPLYPIPATELSAVSSFQTQRPQHEIVDRRHRQLLGRWRRPVAD